MVQVTHARQDDEAGWLALRAALWPDCPTADHRSEIAAVLAEPQRLLALMALSDAGEITGFAEASLRHDYVNGCETSPVVFLEGIFVTPAFRRQGVARALVAAVAAWGRKLGCREFASDARADNDASHAMHAALGFAETERVVFFRKRLDETP
ncbi:aminoglycoside 6'-N-acetyltransferase [Chelatococcus asaccharovorans]|nr:aminoglycoside 6'-N-acetyltransferase [Chelatococcus asaccharovorans]MBS7704290.1 GNAT family N-acetyltransferase [Chelatococcus asaccharovorans]